MFLRDCAVLMRIERRDDSERIWNFGALATSITLSSCALFILTLIFVLLHPAVPNSINPLTARGEIVLLEIAATILSIGAWVDHRFRAYREDISAAKKYMGRSDLVKWWLATFLTIACIAGIGLLVVAGLSTEDGRFNAN